MAGLVVPARRATASSVSPTYPDRSSSATVASSSAASMCGSRGRPTDAAGSDRSDRAPTALMLPQNSYGSQRNENGGAAMRSFDVVTAFNSLQFAADHVAALREMGRVGATVAI